jgi:hypothetical protein
VVVMVTTCAASGSAQSKKSSEQIRAARMDDLR